MIYTLKNVWSLPKKHDTESHLLLAKVSQHRKKKPTKRKLAKDSNDDSDSNNNDLPMVPEVVEDQKLSYNPPHLVILVDKVIVCSSCEIPFKRKDHQEPNNFVFKYMMFQTWPNGWGKRVVNKFWSAGYFHARD